MDRSRILETLREYKERKAGQYGITRIGVFGSCARDASVPGSDVDVVIEMNKPDIFAMVHIKEELEGILKAKVDVVRNRQKMNPYLKKRIDNDAIYV